MTALKIEKVPDDRIIFRQHGENGPLIVIPSFSDAPDGINALLDSIESRCKAPSFTLAVLTVDDWDAELSPWSATAGGRVFAGRGCETLERVSRLIDEEKLSGDPARPVNIIGYSLAGLFALWALYKLPSLSGAASCSGSTWFPGFVSFVENTPLDADKRVYLSLGGKEASAADPVMASVGQATGRIAELLKPGRYFRFEMKKGGHFADPGKRLAAAVDMLCFAENKRI